MLINQESLKKLLNACSIQGKKNIHTLKLSNNDTTYTMQPVQSDTFPWSLSVSD